MVSISNLSFKKPGNNYTFSDLHLDLKTTTKEGNIYSNNNPSGNDVIIDVDKSAIFNSIQNIVLQRRYLTPKLNNSLGRFIGQPVSSMGGQAIGNSIEQLLFLYEPRIKVNNIYVYADPINNAYIITIHLSLLNFTNSSLTMTSIFDNTGNFSIINNN
jgi:phage baseplate assembly protein W